MTDYFQNDISIWTYIGWNMMKHRIQEIWKNLGSVNVRDLVHCSSLSHRWSVFFIRQETRLNGIDIADSSCNRKQTQHLASLSTIQRSVDLRSSPRGGVLSVFVILSYVDRQILCNCFYGVAEWKTRGKKKKITGKSRLTIWKKN